MTTTTTLTGTEKQVTWANDIRARGLAAVAQKIEIYRELLAAEDWFELSAAGAYANDSDETLTDQNWDYIPETCRAAAERTIAAAEQISTITDAGFWIKNREETAATLLWKVR